MSAIAILNHHLDEARAAVAYHRARHALGNMEALIAGLKVAWLKALIREIEAAVSRGDGR